MCGGCGARGAIYPGALTARKRALERRPRVKGHASSGIIKSQKRLLQEAGKLEVVKEMQEASNSLYAEDLSLHLDIPFRE